MTLSHIGADGRPTMVDVGDKPETARSATARGSIKMSPEALALVQGAANPKGDVISTAELAGTMGAKRTSDLIPLCHPLGLDQVTVRATLDEGMPGVRVEATARVHGKTGVEMEALTAVSIALLTVYDMVKAAGHGLEIGQITLVEKTGGRSGNWNKTEKNA
jgi:cyclic pyranopterin phosphate synthase